MSNELSYSRKLEIYQAVKKRTDHTLHQGNFQQLGVDALTLSEALHMDRANVSRILNQLFTDGILIKIQGRPTMYITKDSLERFATNIEHIPSVISKGQNIRQLLFQHSTRSDQTRMNILSNYIGSQPGESLHDAMKSIESAIYYPGGGLNLLIEGKKYIEKGHLASLISQQYQVSYAIKPGKCITINCYNYDVESFSSYISSSDEVRTARILILKNIDSLVAENLERFQFSLTYLLNVVTRKTPTPFLVATSNTFFSADTIPQLRTIFPVIVKLPDFNHRTAKEKLQYTLSIFQQEADFVQMPVSVPKDVVNCFAAAYYSADIQNLKSEIRLAVSAAYSRVFSSTVKLLYIQFEDMAPELLANEDAKDTTFAQLNYLSTCLDLSDFLFIPHSPCQELSVLRDLHMDEKKEQTSSSLFHFCDSMICKKANITTSHNQIASEVYDCMFPILSNTSLIVNSNLLYGLSEYFARLISDIRMHNYHCQFYYMEKEAIEEDFLKLGQNLYQAVSQQFLIPVLKEEEMLTAAYLQQCHYFLSSSKVALLMICNGEHIAESYADYISKQRPELDYYYLNYDMHFKEEGFEKFQQTVTDKLTEIYRTPGVIVLTDTALLAGVCTQFENSNNSSVLTLSPLSLPLLNHVVYLLCDSHYTTNQIEALYRHSAVLTEENATPEDWSKSDESLLKKLQNDILPDNITFLDYMKASQLLLSVYQKIVAHQELPHTQIQLTRFILDGCYAIERTIRQEITPFPHLKAFIERNRSLYQSIEQEMSPVNNSFRIHLPAGEIANLIKVFL